MLAAGSMPPSACVLSAERSIARLIAFRTASWLVGNFSRFGSRLLVWIGGNHTLWFALVLTNACWTPEMKLPAQSSWLVCSADSAELADAYAGNCTLPIATFPPQ